MININLLPKNLKKSERKINLPYKSYCILLGTVLIFLNVSLFAVAASQKVRQVILKKGTGRVSPESKEATAARKEINGLEAQEASFTKVLSRRTSMTELLSGLNAAVPKGLWMERFSFTNDSLMIQGSVVSLNQNEMTIIGKFLEGLKTNKVFSDLFAKIELKSVQRRMIKTYDVVDYVLVGELKK